MEKNKTKKQSTTKNTTKKETIKKTTVSKKTNKKIDKKADDKNINVVIQTNIGNITVELYHREAPVTVKNFLEYVNDKFYDGLIFHRVIDGFMVQGGGFDENLNQKETKAPIKIESDNGLKNIRGTIAMARTQVPDSATSQFFINLVDNSFLDFRSHDISGYGYAVFGKVTDGMDVVDKIATVPTGSFGYMQDVPKYLIQIETIDII